MYVYNIRNPSAITLISYTTIPYLEAISSCIHTCKCNYSYMLYIYIYIYIYLHTCITSELAIHTDIKDNYYRYDYRIKLFFFMDCRSIPMIAVHGVESKCLCHIAYVHIHVVKEVVSFHQLMGVACKRMIAQATDQQEECTLVSL